MGSDKWGQVPFFTTPSWAQRFLRWGKCYCHIAQYMLCSVKKFRAKRGRIGSKVGGNNGFESLGDERGAVDPGRAHCLATDTRRRHAGSEQSHSRLPAQSTVYGARRERGHTECRSQQQI